MSQPISSPQITEYQNYLTKKKLSLRKIYEEIGSTYDTVEKTKPALMYNNESMKKPHNFFDKNQKFTKGGFVQYQQRGESDFIYVLTNGEAGHSQFMPIVPPIKGYGVDRYGRNSGG